MLYLRNGTLRLLGLMAVAAAIGMLTPSTASAEGTRDLIGGDPAPFEAACADTGDPDNEHTCPFQGLRRRASLHVDILDTDDEFIVWCSGKGSRVQIRDPEGDLVPNPATDDDSWAPGDRIDPVDGMTGAYRIVRYQSENDPVPFPDSEVGDQFLLLSDSNVAAKFAWDVQVFSEAEGCTIDPGDYCEFSRPCERNGRLYSDDWEFDTGSFRSDASTNASYYALVPGGDPGATAVLELDLEGLSGFVYRITGNRIGVNGTNGGRSVFQAGNSVSEEFRLYLNPPEIAGYEVAVPDVDSFSVSSGAQECGVGDLPPLLAPGASEISFFFETNVEGTYQFICDLNPSEGGDDPIGDGVFDITDDADLLLNGTMGEVEPPDEPDCVLDPDRGIWMCEVVWDGLDNDGIPIPSGPDLDNTIPIDCQVRVTVGEFHYVGRDMETSFPGFRFF